MDRRELAGRTKQATGNEAAPPHDCSDPGAEVQVGEDTVHRFQRQQPALVDRVPFDIVGKRGEAG